MYIDIEDQASRNVEVFDDDTDPPTRLGYVVAVNTDEHWILQYSLSPTGVVESILVGGEFHFKVSKKFGNFRVEFKNKVGYQHSSI